MTAIDPRSAALWLLIVGLLGLCVWAYRTRITDLPLLPHLTATDEPEPRAETAEEKVVRLHRKGYGRTAICLATDLTNAEVMVILAQHGEAA